MRAAERITLYMNQLIADVSKLFEDDDPTVSMTEFMPPTRPEVGLQIPLVIGDDSVKPIPASN